MRMSTPAREPNRSGLLRRGGLAAVLVLTCWGLAGCAADFNAQTNQQYQPGEGISDRDNGVYVLNALVVTDGTGNGTLVGTLLNQSNADDALQSVTVTDAEGQAIKTTQRPKPVALAPQTPFRLEAKGTVRLSGDGVVAGDYVEVTFSFHNSAPVKINIPTVADGPVYTGVPVGPA